MTLKRKAAMVALVSLALLAIYAFSLRVEPPGEETPGEEAAFAPTADPFAVLLAAMEDEKPVALKFYSRL